VQPNVFDQLVFGYQRVTMFQKIEKDLEGLLANVLFAAVPFQAHLRGINFDPVKAIYSVDPLVHGRFNYETNISAEFQRSLSTSSGCM
ncbi:MAG: hypothetical protein LC776_06870, partial [Acidobacteria bacterium]|nr:hypothetical protein [Acidobacteriota bacterium]